MIIVLKQMIIRQLPTILLRLVRIFNDAASSAEVIVIE
jgi:hypothetical protein